MAEHKKRSAFSRFIRYLILILLLGLVALYFIFSYTYSEGTRAGVLIKFSKRGVLFKTYEGELNQGAAGNVPNTAQFNQTWEFSVRNQAVADTLMKLEGRKVSLFYKQKVKNFPWEGDTPYFIEEVHVIE